MLPMKKNLIITETIIYLNNFSITNLRTRPDFVPAVLLNFKTMKLIHITAVKEFEKKVKDILLHSGVQAFSYGEVRGFKANSSVSSAENWFASSGVETDSFIFTVFADDEVLEKIAERIRKFNTQQEFESRIHLAAVAVEQII